VNPAGVLTFGGGCEPGWRPTFGQRPGLDYQVRALAAFDEGDGPTLFAAGDFLQAGSVSAFHVARWDGWSWTEMGEGLGSAFDTGLVAALAVSEVGGAPSLYAGGEFGSLGANNVARWTGTTWAKLGSVTTGGVYALATFDDGSGPQLYAGGSFGRPAARARAASRAGTERAGRRSRAA